MKTQLQIFYTAIQFYTRIPVPSISPFRTEYLAQSARYFTLIGWIVGILTAEVFWFGNLLWGIDIAILLSMAFSIRLTGAFHEDGLADACDGFGGGWNKDKILEIMKDSRLGTFGVTGLILSLTLKFLCLRSLPVEWIPAAIVCGHSLSRMVASRLLYRGKYVENNNLAKAGSAAQKLSFSSLLTNLFMGILTLLLFSRFNLSQIQILSLLAIVTSLFAVESYLFRFFYKWVGGYNGDCAGTVQQISELVFYLGLVTMLKYTAL